MAVSEMLWVAPSCVEARANEVWEVWEMLLVRWRHTEWKPNSQCKQSEGSAGSVGDALGGAVLRGSQGKRSVGSVRDALGGAVLREELRTSEGGE